MNDAIVSSMININTEEGFLINNSKDYIIYFPLRQTILNVTEEGFHILKLEQKNSKKRADIENVIYKKIILNPKYRFENKSKNNTGFNVLGLALTTSCNLRCKYCHAQAGKNFYMDTQIIEDSIQQIFKLCEINKQGMYLVFTGSGEPTQNWDALANTVLKTKMFCNKSQLPIHISMASNGVFDDVKRSFIFEHFSRITLSLDGPKYIHDEFRVNAHGEGTFDKVFDTVKFFFYNKFPIRIRSTIAAKNAGRMLEIYEFFQKEFPGIKISFEPLNPIGRGLELKETPNDNEFVSGYLNILKKHGNTNVSNSAITSIYKLRKNFCSPVTTPNINISVDGQVYACSRANSGKDFKFGTYDKNENKLKFNKHKIRELRSWDVFSYSDCKHCFAKYHCAGDCYDLRINNYNRCDTNRSILYFFIMEQLNS